MREGPGLTVVVTGDAATVDAVRAAVASAGYCVHAITDVDELDAVPTAIRSDAFAIVLDTSKAAADRLVPRIWGLVDEDVHCVIVSDEASAFPSLESVPWEALLAKPIVLDELRSALEMIWDMLDLEPDRPLRPGEEEERRRYEEESEELHRLLMADLERRTMMAETETPEETHSLDFFEMLFGDDNADDGKVPVAEYRALRAVRWDLAAYLATRVRIRDYAKRLPEDVQRAARAGLKARATKRS